MAGLMTPDDVAAQVEEQAHGFYRQAIGQLTLGASSLRNAVELMTWTPYDADAIEISSAAPSSLRWSLATVSRLATSRQP